VASIGADQVPSAPELTVPIVEPPAPTTTTTAVAEIEAPQIREPDSLPDESTKTQVRFLENPENFEQHRRQQKIAAAPPLPAESGEGRRIVYSNSLQQVWLIEEDGTIFTSHAVSGRRNTPRPGTYEVYSKSPKAWAGHHGITMNHMVRFARGQRLAIGFHSIPTHPSGRPLQSEGELGTYRSSGCVRQAPRDALILYEWAGIGTTVVVLP